MTRFAKIFYLSTFCFCSFFQNVSAEGSSTYSGPFILLNDYITLNTGVSSSYPLAAVSFDNQKQMAEGIELCRQSFVVTASHGWKAQVIATDFTRVGENSVNSIVAGSFPASALQMKSAFITPQPTGTVFTAKSFFTNASGQSLVRADQGGVNIEFEVIARLTPGSASGISGDYESDLSVIASLD